MLLKGIFVGNFLKKSQSYFVYVIKVGTRSFDKISIKLFNRCVGLSRPPDIGLFFKSLGQRTCIYTQNFQSLLHFLLARIYVPLVNNKSDYLRFRNLLDNLLLFLLI